MAAPWRYRVTVNSAKLDRLFVAGGDVWRWMDRVGLETKNLAVAMAPARTGTLKALHGYNLTPNGKRHTRYTVFNDAPYARYVHDGTTGPITSTRAKGMLLVRPSPHSFFGRYVPMKSVAGQKANPWLLMASDRVMASHRIH